MNRVQLFFGSLLLISFVGCSQQQQSAVPATAISPAPNAGAQVALPSPSAGISGSVSAPPTGNAATNASVSANSKVSATNPAMVPGKDGKPPQLPPGMDRMYRALTLEEINQLPPATRDMILKAQGRYPGSPTPTPKK